MIKLVSLEMFKKCVDVACRDVVWVQSLGPGSVRLMVNEIKSFLYLFIKEIKVNSCSGCT